MMSSKAAWRQASGLGLSLVQRTGEQLPVRHSSVLKPRSLAHITRRSRANGLRTFSSASKLLAVAAGVSASSSGVAMARGEDLKDAEKPAQRVPNQGQKPEVVLYQYDVCPFCCKVKAYLDLAQVPYTAIEVNPLSKAELKAKTDYRMVPVAFVDGEEVRESLKIIQHVDRLLPNPKDGEENRLGSSELDEKFMKWTDDHLVHLLPPNIYRTPSEALEAFDYISNMSNFSTYQKLSAKYVGAAAMYAISKKLKKKYSIVNEREELYAAVNEWIDAIGHEKPFLGGMKPSLADVGVFGVLRSLEGYRTFDDLMANTELRPWYERMAAFIGPSARVIAA